MKIASCEFPVRIYNKYIDEYIHVPCRKCSMCRNAKTMDMVNRLQYEASKYKHSLFFTLTYSPDYVPHYNISYEDGDICFYREDNTLSKNFQGYSVEEWYNEDGESLEFFRLSEFPDCSSDLSSQKVLVNVLRDDGRWNVCSKSHCRQFVNRLSYHLKKFYNEKLRYFLVSEYGCSKTNNYRPHYHGILFTNSSQVASCAYKIFCSCWQLGFVALSPVEGKAFGYVAKYVNSLDSYPKIYGIPDARPFTLYSRRPTIGVFEDTDEIVKEIFFDEVNDIMLYSKTSISALPFWRSFESRIFPKCREFGKISHLDRVKRYGFLPEYDRQFSKAYYQEKVLKDLTDEQYRDYQTARRVNKLCVVLGVSLEDYVSRIERYYNHKELLGLSNFYQYQYDLLKKRPDKWKELMQLYPEAVVQFENYVKDNVKKGNYSPFYLSLSDCEFRKFRPYFGLDKVKDLRDIDLTEFSLANSEIHSSAVFKSRKTEKDSLKTKKINEHFNLLD